MTVNLKQLETLINKGLILTTPQIKDKHAVKENAKVIMKLTDVSDERLHTIHIAIDSAEGYLTDKTFSEDKRVELVNSYYQKAYLMLLSHPKFEQFQLTKQEFKTMNHHDPTDMVHQKLIETYGLGNEPFVVMMGMNVNLGTNLALMEMYTLPKDNPVLEQLNQKLNKLHQ